MKKNILVVTGSPRPDGNSKLLADAVVAGIESSGNNAMRIDVGRKQLTGCRACNTCFVKGKACLFDDEYNLLVPSIQKADAIVFVTPLYWFGFPSELKCFIDKFYSFEVGKQPLLIHDAALVACGGTDDEADFEGLVKNYQLICQYKKWNDRGVLLVTSVNNPGDVAKTLSLQKAEKLGSSL